MGLGHLGLGTNLLPYEGAPLARLDVIADDPWDILSPHHRTLDIVKPKQKPCCMSSNQSLTSHHKGQNTQTSIHDRLTNKILN